jgi:hypothetical protein
MDTDMLDYRIQYLADYLKHVQACKAQAYGAWVDSCYRDTQAHDTFVHWLGIGVDTAAD